MKRVFKLVSIAVFSGIIGCAGLTACGGNGRHSAATAGAGSACKAATAKVITYARANSNQYEKADQADLSICTTMAALAGSKASWFDVTGDCLTTAAVTSDSHLPACQDVLRQFQEVGGLVDNGVANSGSTFIPAFNRLAKVFASEGGTETLTGTGIPETASGQPA